MVAGGGFRSRELRFLTMRREGRGAGAAEPNMKKRMKRIARRTTESWPSNRPCAKDQLLVGREVSWRYSESGM
jgi:hypothetical protein